MYPPVPSWSFQSKLSDCRIERLELGRNGDRHGTPLTQIAHVDEPLKHHAILGHAFVQQALPSVHLEFAERVIEFIDRDVSDIVEIHARDIVRDIDE